VQIILGKFKPKEISRCSCKEKCQNCKTKPEKTPLIKHEEKNTDVNIAITLVEKALLKEYDICYILSSDSDFNTAIERAKFLYPQGKLILVPPPLPSNSSRTTPYYISNVIKLCGSRPLFISWNKIKNYQFSNSILLADGQTITNPF